MMHGTYNVKSSTLLLESTYPTRGSAVFLTLLITNNTAKMNEILVTALAMLFGERLSAWQRTEAPFFVVCLTPQAKGNTILRNVWKHSTTQRHITEGLHPHQHRCENLKSRNLLSILPKLSTFTSCSLFTHWSRVLLKTLAAYQLVKKFPAFYGPRRFITACTSARHLSSS